MSKNNISLVILTSNSWRHKFVANYLMRHFNVLGVVSEAKRALNQGATQEENKIIDSHKQEREDKELEFFGKQTDFNLPADKVLRVEYGDINSKEVAGWVSKLDPTAIALFGTGIVYDPILSTYKNRIINMHLGLSPYYRGSATLFWPLVEGEPECIGATIHLATDMVDAGSILAQVRPMVKVGDGSHDIGFRTIRDGVEIFALAIEKYLAGRVSPKAQRADIGKVFKLVDFGAKPVTQMKQNFAEGMIDDYLKNKESRDGKYPIVEL